jgi:uncharacterized protein YcfL
MKKVIAIISCLFLLAACGAKSEKASTEMSLEQEQVVADSLATSIEQSRNELSNEIEEDLQEIDSLLENF